MIIRLLPSLERVSSPRTVTDGVKAVKAIIFATAAAVAISSCTELDYEIPQSELYAREFVKKYGISSQGHTFSMAKAAQATVTLL